MPRDRISSGQQFQSPQREGLANRYFCTASFGPYRPFAFTFLPSLTSESPHHCREDGFTSCHFGPRQRR
uniref:Uncharacterized protein n=1 Tax=Anguilla anguilla TaxID=7936 RepID=A0A0E9SEX4_ANGAN